MKMMEVFSWLIENCISGTLNGVRFYNNLDRRYIVITLTLYMILLLNNSVTGSN